MLKKRELNECQTLFELMKHPDVFPYVRQKPNSYEEYLFLTKQLMQEEDNGLSISRTICDERANPIGTITLYDITNASGFLATWIGRPFFGKGYNRTAKEEFFQELFFSLSIESVYMKIRKTNERSLRAALKLPYVAIATEAEQRLFEKANKTNELYHLLHISKCEFIRYANCQGLAIESHVKEA